MKKFITILVASPLCFLFTINLKAESTLLPMLPEQTVFLVEVDDLKGMSESIESGPLGELSQSNAWEKIGNWVEGKMQSELGENSDDIELLFERIKEWEKSMNGSAVLAMGNLEKMLSKKMPDITLLMETDFSQKKLNDTLKWIKKEVISSGGKFSWEREKIAGEEVHWIGSGPTKEKNEQMAIFLSGQTLGFLLGGKDHVTDTLLRAAGNSSGSSLARNDNYLDLFEEIEEGAARIFLDFEALGGLLKVAGSIPKMQIPENPFGVTTTNLISAMGIDSMQCLGIQLDPSNEDMVISSAIFFSKFEGIFSFVQPEGKDEAILYDFIPAQAFTSTSMRYDFSKLWTTTEKIISELSPQLLLLVNSQIQAFEEQAEVAFRRDILGSLGNEAFSFSLLPGKVKTIKDFEKTSDFFGISLKDSELFDRSLRTMIDSFSAGNDLFQERVHQGVTIRKLRGLEQSGISFSYAVTEKWLLLAMGEDNQLNQIINRINGKGLSLWQQKEIKLALGDLADGSNQIEFADFEKLVSFLSSIAVISSESEEDLELKSSDFPDFPYFLMAWSKTVRRGIKAKARLYPKSN
jgi:hypothetical protein